MSDKDILGAHKSVPDAPLHGHADKDLKAVPAGPYPDPRPSAHGETGLTTHDAEFGSASAY